MHTQFKVGDTVYFRYFESDVKQVTIQDGPFHRKADTEGESLRQYFIVKDGDGKIQAAWSERLFPIS